MRYKRRRGEAQTVAAALPATEDLDTRCEIMAERLKEAVKELKQLNREMYECIGQGKHPLFAHKKGLF